MRFHELTTQQRHEAWLALDGKARTPKTDSLALRIVRFTGAALQEGREAGIPKQNATMPQIQQKSGWTGKTELHRTLKSGVSELEPGNRAFVSIHALRMATRANFERKICTGKISAGCKSFTQAIAIGGRDCFRRQSEFGVAYSLFANSV